MYAFFIFFKMCGNVLAFYSSFLQMYKERIDVKNNYEEYIWKVEGNDE